MTYTEKDGEMGEHHRSPIDSLYTADTPSLLTSILMSFPNIEDIPFDRAVMASGLSSNKADYFSPEEAVFVGWKE